MNRNRKPKRRLKRAAILLIALGAAALAAAVFADRAAIRWMESFAARAGLSVRIGGLDWMPLGRVELRDFTLGERDDSPVAASFDAARFRYESFRDLLAGRLSEAAFENPRVDIPATQAAVARLAAARTPSAAPAQSLQAMIRRLPARIEARNLLLGEKRLTMALDELRAAISETVSSGTLIRLSARAAGQQIAEDLSTEPIDLAAEVFLHGDAARIAPLSVRVGGRQSLRATAEVGDWREPAMTSLRAEVRDFAISDALARFLPEWSQRLGGSVENCVLTWNGERTATGAPPVFILHADFHLRDAFAAPGGGFRIEEVNQDVSVRARLDAQGRAQRIHARATGTIGRVQSGPRAYSDVLWQLAFDVAPREGQRNILDIIIDQSLTNEGQILPGETQLQILARGAGHYDMSSQVIEAQLQESFLEARTPGEEPVRLDFSGEARWDAARPVSFANFVRGRVTGVGEGVDMDFRPGPEPILSLSTERAPLADLLRMAGRLGAPVGALAVGDLSGSATLTLAAPDDARLGADLAIGGLGPGLEAPAFWRPVDAEIRAAARINPVGGQWQFDALTVKIPGHFLAEGAAYWDAAGDNAIRFQGQASTPDLNRLAQTFAASGVSWGAQSELQLLARADGQFALNSRIIEARFEDCFLEARAPNAEPLRLELAGEARWDATRPASPDNVLHGRVTGIGHGVDINFRPAPEPTLSVHSDRAPIADLMDVAARLGAPVEALAVGELSGNLSLIIKSPDDARLNAEVTVAGLGPGLDAPFAWRAADADIRAAARFHPAQRLWTFDSLSIDAPGLFLVEGAGSWNQAGDRAIRFSGNASTPDLNQLAGAFLVFGAELGGEAEFAGEAIALAPTEFLRADGNWRVRGGVIQAGTAGVFIDGLDADLPATARVSRGAGGRFVLDLSTRPGAATVGFLEALNVMAENLDGTWQGGDLAVALSAAPRAELRGVAVSLPGLLDARVDGSVDFAETGARPNLDIAFDSDDLESLFAHVYLPFPVEMSGSIAGTTRVEASADAGLRVETSLQTDSLDYRSEGGVWIQDLQTAAPFHVTIESGGGTRRFTVEPQTIEAARIVAGGATFEDVKTRMESKGSLWNFREIETRLFDGELTGIAYLSLSAAEGEWETGIDVDFSNIDLSRIRGQYAPEERLEETGYGEFDLDGRINGQFQTTLRNGKHLDAQYRFHGAGGPVLIDRHTILNLLMADRPPEDQLIYQRFLQRIIIGQDMVPFQVAEGEGHYIPPDPEDWENSDEFLLRLHLINSKDDKQGIVERTRNTVRRIVPFMGKPFEGDLNLTIDAKLDRLELLRQLKLYQEIAEEDARPSP